MFHLDELDGHFQPINSLYPFVAKAYHCIYSNITMIYCVEETPVFRNMIYFLHCRVQHLQNGRSNQIQTSQIHASCLETSTFFARKRLLETSPNGRSGCFGLLQDNSVRPTFHCGK